MASGVPGKRKVSLKEEGLVGGLRKDLGVPRGEMPKISKGYSKDHPAVVTMGRSDSLCPVALVSSALLCLPSGLSISGGSAERTRVARSVPVQQKSKS